MAPLPFWADIVIFISALFVVLLLVWLIGHWWRNNTAKGKAEKNMSWIGTGADRV